MKILFAESPTNPAVDIIDLELLGYMPKTILILVIDNCFATPYLTYKMGAHLVVHCYKVNGWSRKFYRRVIY
jgi:O-succinylhomoserine sulfhydrylase